MTTYTVHATRRDPNGTWRRTPVTLRVGDVVDGWRIVEPPVSTRGLYAMNIAEIVTEAGAVGQLMRVTETHWGGYALRPHVNPFNADSAYYNEYAFPVEPAS